MMKVSGVILATGLAGVLGAAEPGKNQTALPLREIILYSSGVGYFERSGNVEGNAELQLRFRTEQINDLLKSLVVRDLGGGTVGVISYESRDPISKTLASFAVDLSSNLSMRELLIKLRGEQVEVLWPNSTSGTVLGVERREVERQEDKTRHEDFLNLFTGGTLKSIPLSAVQELKLQNPRIQKELEEALAVLAKSHDTEKKSVSLTFNGEGEREVNIAYLLESPVWKTSYRLVLGENGRAYLQGWALVENTSDEDWESVQLSLVSGRPISFKMDLYQPLYAPRPTVEPELYLSLRPQVYRDALESAREEKDLALADSVQMPMAAAGIPAQRKLSYYYRSPEAKSEVLGRETGTAALAEGGATGELFQYALKIPISIQRQRSAMLPILGEDVKGAKLSIYNQSVQARHPLNGYRLTNTTDLHLMQGPITVFDGGSYAGDARIEDLAPGQDRLISYAVDLQTEVEPAAKSHPETLVNVRIWRGTFMATKKLVEEKTYTIRNKGQEAKVVLIEHPYRADWNLEAPAEPMERTREVYRFKVELPAGKTEKLLVREYRQLHEETHVTSLHPNTYGFYLRADKVSEAVKGVLRRVVAYRDEIARLEAQRKLREERLNEISQEQSRIRENMARLTQNSELYQRYVKKFDEQETEFERLRAESRKLREQEAAKRREMEEYLSKVELK